MTPGGRALVLDLEAAGVIAELKNGSIDLGPRSRLTRDLHLRVAAAKRELVEHLGAAATPSPQPHVRPAAPIVVRFQTHCPVSIADVGARAYAEHPQLAILCGVLLLPDGSVVEWEDGPVPPLVVKAIARGAGMLSFSDYDVERFVWRRLGWPDASWADGVVLARMNGLPDNLDAVARDVLGVARDGIAAAPMVALRKFHHAGHLASGSRRDREALVRRSRVEVFTARKIWDEGLHAAIFVEPAVRELDAVINERGFAFDVDLARAILRVERRLARAAQSGLTFPSKLLGSPYNLKRFLGDAGITVRNTQRAVLLQLLEDPDLADDLRRTVTAHLGAEGIVSHKLATALRRVGSDGRLRDTLAFHGAHTGRWSGRGFQPQNLPRGVKFETEAELERAVDAVLHDDLAELQRIAETSGTTAHGINAALVRACVRAPAGQLLAVVDYAQIEARVLAWMAGDADALRRFRDGVDPYRVMAATLFDVVVERVDGAIHRPLGKVAEIGCGYQMGAARFEVYAAAHGIDWSVLSLTSAGVVAAWRKSHPAVSDPDVGVWACMQDAAHRAVSGESSIVGPVVWERRGEDVICMLPSGRPLIYRRARLEMRITPWGKQARTFTYELRGERVTSYGGKLTENVVQGVCRDLLARSLDRLEHAGKRPVLHVHDETICEIDDPSKVEEIVSLMCGAPYWAAGLPLDAAGYAGQRYRKT